MIFTALAIFALVFAIVALGYVFFFAGQSRKLKPIQAAFMITVAIMLSFQLFEKRLPDAVARPGMLVIALAVLTVSVLYLLDWWKSLNAKA